MNIRVDGDLKRTFSDLDFKTAQESKYVNNSIYNEEKHGMFGFEPEDLEKMYFMHQDKKAKWDASCNGLDFVVEYDPSAQDDDKSNIQIIRALWKKDRELAESLITQSKNLDKSFYFRVEQNELIETTSSDQNSHEMTPLSEALRQRTTAVVKLLIANKVNVNQSVRQAIQCFSPLELAIQFAFVEAIDLLHQAGANLMQFSLEGYDLLSLAKVLDNKKAIRKLSSLGLSAKISNEVIERVGLSSIWGIDGNTEVVDKFGNKRDLALCGGLYRIHATKLMNRYWNSFLASDVLTSNQKKLLKVTKRALVGNATYDEIKSKVRRGIPCVIQRGYQGHAISFVFMSCFLAICNRGELLKIDKTTQAFSLPFHLITPELVNKLLKIYPNKEAYLEMVNSLNLTEFVEYNEKQKPQKRRNCAITCQKASLHFIIKRILQADGDAVYKKFTSYLRHESLKRYKKVKYRGQDFNLIKAVEAKKTLKYGS